MLSFHLRRFFASSLPKLNSFKQVKDVAPSKLKREEIKELIDQYHLNSWNYAINVSHVDIHTHEVDKHETKETQQLEKTYFFRNYKQAFAFMDVLASIVDQMDHHPDWHQIDSEVDVRLSTHDVGNAVSYKDILLARTMDHVAKTIKERKIEFSLQEESLNLDNILSDALHEEGIRQDKHLASLNPDQGLGLGRKVPDARDAHRGKSTTDVKKSKRPGDKSGDSTSSEHYAEKTNL